jgi:hypothetical protein
MMNGNETQRIASPKPIPMSSPSPNEPAQVVEPTNPERTEERAGTKESDATRMRRTHALSLAESSS